MNESDELRKDIKELKINQESQQKINSMLSGTISQLAENMVKISKTVAKLANNIQETNTIMFSIIAELANRLGIDGNKMVEMIRKEIDKNSDRLPEDNSDYLKAKKLIDEAMENKQNGTGQ